MEISIDRISFMRDGFSAELDWNTEIIGLDTSTVNIEIAASGFLATVPGSSMPSTIQVLLTSRISNQDSGLPTILLPQQLIRDVPKDSPNPADPDSTLYRLMLSISDIGFSITPGVSGVRNVATVVRPGGTSDIAFLTALAAVNSSPRGRATQPIAPGVRTGSLQNEIPDAFALLQAGGVEVLDAAIVPFPNLHIQSSHAWHLIRRTADIFYYTGHGWGDRNCLAIVPPGSPQAVCWASVSDIASSWSSSLNLEALIIAGCAVLKIDFSASPAIGPGLQWAKLLTTNGGPLTALLGYSDLAPLDAHGGDDIASEMGARIAGGSRNYVRDWLEVNANHRAWNAVAMDTGGYWWVTQDVPVLTLHTIHSQVIP